jgi:hypothetical protein
MTPATMKMHRALNALYIAVEKGVADDVSAKVRERVEELEFALKEIRAAVKETVGADEDELLLMLDGLARDALDGNELNSPQESGSKNATR